MTERTCEVFSFDELSKKQLIEVLKLRQDIFIVEQVCPFPDIDGYDELCEHVILSNTDQKIIGYTRLSGPGVLREKASVGRIVVHQKFRTGGVGFELISFSINELRKRFPNEDIEIGAQLYLKDYYSKFGFEATNHHYLEDGIPHITMVLKP